ncbi:MAG: flagellar hook-length control protein FliK, partial [Rhodoferax sp.]
PAPELAAAPPTALPLAAQTAVQMAMPRPLTAPGSEPRFEPELKAGTAQNIGPADELAPVAANQIRVSPASASASAGFEQDPAAADPNAATQPAVVAGTGSPNSSPEFLLNPASQAAPRPELAAPLTSSEPIARARIEPEVGSAQWDKALSQHVLQFSRAGHQVTELQLNPPGLGPLKVTLDLNDHQMQLVFVSAHASVRAAVEAAVPQLRASLADSGISLGNTSVSSESQPQAAFAQNQGGASGHRAYRSSRVPEAPAFGARPTPAARRQGEAGSVDTYA